MGPGPGRPKGSQNKVTKDLKDMILGALDQAGGMEYLYQQAVENPKAFLALLSRVLPKDLNVKTDVNLDALIREARELALKR